MRVLRTVIPREGNLVRSDTKHWRPEHRDSAPKHGLPESSKENEELTAPGTTSHA
ncbi:MAG: hypothetical protein NZ920_00315 [Aigarchaeota archaeon]|nr:hypothetical protein [Aigarchaeota archaeon]MDW8092748.1 hypothetical protein [Nitrososphaerota archaeon]